MATAGASPAQIQLFEISSESPQSTLADGRELLLEYGRFVLAQPGAGRFCFGTLENEAADLPQSFIVQGGGSLIAYARSVPAGFVAWRTLPDAVEPNAFELKRLWVRPGNRGLSLGRMLTMAVMDRVRAVGGKVIFLDTAPASMGAAHRLYLELGFEPCARYNENPVEELAYLRKLL